jgi:WD40 repeat protein
VWTGAGAPWAELPNHGGAVWSLAFSSDSRTLATGDAAQRAVRLWDVQTGREQAPLDAIPGAVFALAFAADGQTLAAGGTDGQNGVLLRWTSLPRGE